MFTFLSFWTLALTSIDPLFLRMVGDWTGEGERFFPQESRHTHFMAKVSTLVEGDLLISQNEITETQVPTGPARTYSRVYWIRKKAGTPELLYELGYGSTVTDSIAGEGKLEGNRFKMNQNMGGNPPLMFESQTEFVSENESLYVDTLQQGGGKLSSSHIKYLRTTLPKGP